MTTNTKPIGVAYEDQNIIGADRVYVDSELGYTAAAQGTVTQLTNKGTSVTINKPAGRITMNNAALLGGAAISFTVNNTFVSSNDLVLLNISAGATAASYNIWVDTMVSGAFTISVLNRTGGSLSEAVVINFAIIHCV
jgi:hypothetical protein